MHCPTGVLYGFPSKNSILSTYPTTNETVNTQAPPMDDSHWSCDSEQQSYWPNLQSVIEMTRQLIKGTAVIPQTWLSFIPRVWYILLMVMYQITLSYYALKTYGIFFYVWLWL